MRRLLRILGRESKNRNLPYDFLYNEFIFIKHMICDGQHRVLEERVGAKVELKFEHPEVICPKTLDVHKMFERSLIIVYINLNIKITTY